MTRMAPALALLLALAACGVDGRPIPPQDVPEERDNPRVLVTGSVGIGVGGRL